MNIYDTIAEIDDLAERQVLSMKRGKPVDAWLDPRSGSHFHYDEFCIVVKKTLASMFEYYSGFSYVDPEHRIEMGEYVVYLSENIRVAQSIEKLKGE